MKGKDKLFCIFCQEFMTVEKYILHLEEMVGLTGDWEFLEEGTRRPGSEEGG